jgi:hypothetical protein
MSVRKNLILGRWSTQSREFMSVFFWSLCCLSFFYLLHLITSLVSSHFPKMILFRVIAMLGAVKCVVHISMINYRRLLHMINWCDKMTKKYPTVGTDQNSIDTILLEAHSICLSHIYMTRPLTFLPIDKL